MCRYEVIFYPICVLFQAETPERALDAHNHTTASCSDSLCVPSSSSLYSSLTPSSPYTLKTRAHTSETKTRKAVVLHSLYVSLQ